MPGCAMNTLSRVQALKARQPSAACESHLNLNLNPNL